MSPELRGATFVATGVLLGALVTSLLTGDGGPATRPDVTPITSGSDELLQAVSRLEQAIAQLAQREAPAARPTRQRSPVTDQGVVDDATSLIERLEQAVAGLSAARPAQQSPMVDLALRTRPTDPVAIEQMLQLLGSDDGKVARESRFSMLLATPADVLRRFGRPSRVYADQNGAEAWEYIVGERGMMVRFSPQGHVLEVDN